MAGSLNSATDFSLFFQNFTALRPAGPVVQLPANGGDASVSYRFQLAYNLPEFAFQVALTAFLESEGEKIGEGDSAITIPKASASTFFNSTVQVVEPAKVVDWQLLQMGLMLSGLAAVGAWLLYQHLVSAGYLGGGSSGSGGVEGKEGSGSKSSKASTSISASTSASSSKASDKSQWLQGVNLGPSSKSQKKRS